MIHADVLGARLTTRSETTFTQYYGSEELDAATLLMIGAVGFLPGDDPRVGRHDRGDQGPS